MTTGNRRHDETTCRIGMSSRNKGRCGLSRGGHRIGNTNNDAQLMENNNA